MTSLQAQSILICTNHLYQWAGSELVALEIMEACLAKGMRTALYVPFADRNFYETFLPVDVTLWTNAAEVPLLQFDVVYSQHQTHVALYAAQDWSAQDWGAEDRPQLPRLICAHLSPWEAMELPGHFLEPVAADIVLANSPETRERIARFGLLCQPIDLWQNPAPACFEGSPADAAEKDMPTGLTRLLVVSHHVPSEMSKALTLLEEQGVSVTRIGQASMSRRVRPSDIHSHDAVVSIGKTVQYALRSRRPVFCYDHFGGPGWLDENNFEAAADANFSGRCRGYDGADPPAPDQLARRLVNEFPKARQFASRLTGDDLKNFALEHQLDRLLHPVTGSARLLSHLSTDQDRFIAHLDLEASRLNIQARYYGATWELKKSNVSLNETIGKLRERVKILEAHVASLEEHNHLLRAHNKHLEQHNTDLRHRLQEKARQHRPDSDEDMTCA